MTSHVADESTTKITLAGRLFEPMDASDVRVYQCGPTVYAAPHLGNLRSAVLFDVLHRLLRRVHGADAVRFVRNYTDIDDKLMLKASQRGVGIDVVADEAIGFYERDTRALAVIDPIRPRATDHIGDMQMHIAKLIDAGAAYEVDGHVLFDRTRHPEFHINPNLDPAAMREGEGNSYKRNPADFVLWKPSLPDQPGWRSIWGRGRPGWHIECSSMIGSILGEEIDIHCGGIDLRFPHHENECAQTTTLTGKPLARHWLHNGLLELDDGKMAKSRGNVMLLEDALRHATPMGVRYFLLRGRYSEPLTLDREMRLITESDAAFRRLERAHRMVMDVDPSGGLEEIADDLGTPEAIARAHIIAKSIFDGSADTARMAEYRGLLQVLGLDELIVQVINDDAETLIAKRAEARDRRDFAEADRIRAILVERGIEIQDRRS